MYSHIQTITTHNCEYFEVITPKCIQTFKQNVTNNTAQSEVNPTWHFLNMG